MTSLPYTVLTALTACVALAPGFAHAAAPAGAPPTVTVRYADLNLGTDEGTTALYARLVSAARKVCVVSDIRDLDQMAAARACQQQAIANAVREVHSPKLAAVYTARWRHG